MNAKKTPTIVTWTLLVKTQMDPLCAPVYLDLTEMDGTAQVIASLWLWEMLVARVCLLVCFDKVVTLALIFLINGRK